MATRQHRHRQPGASSPHGPLPQAPSSGLKTSCRCTCAEVNVFAFRPRIQLATDSNRQPRIQLPAGSNRQPPIQLAICSNRQLRIQLPTGRNRQLRIQLPTGSNRQFAFNCQQVEKSVLLLKCANIKVGWVRSCTTSLSEATTQGEKMQRLYQCCNFFAPQLAQLGPNLDEQCTDKFFLGQYSAYFFLQIPHTPIFSFCTNLS